MNDQRWRGWLVAIAIFILGVGVGGAGMAWAGIRVFRHVLQNPTNPHGLAERMAERIGTDLTKKLDLTPAESTRVKTILSESAVNLKALRAKAGTDVAAELRATFQQVAAALPQEKRPELYRAIAQRYKRLGLVAPDMESKP